MGLYKHIQHIKSQIIDTENLLKMVVNHPLMSQGLKERLAMLKKELNDLPKDVIEPTIQLLFSGNAVKGSQGVKSSFISKTIAPFQEMVKTQAALIRFGKVGKRGQAKSGANAELYLTALPTGSFGVELSQLEAFDLFDSIDISNAMKQVISLIADTAESDEAFEKIVDKTPRRNLASMKKFLQEIVDEKSILKMESGDLGIEISEAKVNEAFQRVSSTIEEETDIFVNGIFRGILLDSGRFEIQDEEGRQLSGFISETLSEDLLIQYDKEFLNKNCRVHIKAHKTKFKTGNEKTDYELLEIQEA